MINWLLIDIDAIDQRSYNLLAADRRAFPHPPLGVFAVPVDGFAPSVQRALEALMRDLGIPQHAIRVADPPEDGRPCNCGEDVAPPGYLRCRVCTAYCAGVGDGIRTT